MQYIRVLKTLLIVLALSLYSLGVHAQTAKAKTGWPKQAIRIVVSFTPGGAPDILARVLAESWQQSLGVPVLVENRPGYGGNIGADLVAKSEPDGYTLLIGTVGIHAINGALYEKMSFDPVKDFTPISFLASTPNVLIVNKRLGVTNLHELIELAKTTGGTIMVPTGALIGLDAMVAAAEGEIFSVKMVTNKPPLGLKGAPHLIENNISVDGLTEPLKVFSGNAREAAKGFPANLNVVVALALAGVGPEKTHLEIWADPTVVRNTHTITVESDSAKFSMKMENILKAEQDGKVKKVSAAAGESLSVDQIIIEFE